MSAHVGPNMTPMVDVVMCILIFFMLGSSFLAQEMFLTSNTTVVKGGLGTEQTNQKLPAVKMFIDLTRSGSDTWVSAFESELMKMDRIEDSNPRSNETIFSRLEARRKTVSDDVQVLIAAGSGVPYQDVVTIYNQCIKLQFKQVAFYPVELARRRNKG